MISIQQACILGAAALGIGGPDFDGSTAAVNDLPTDDKLALTAWLGAYIRDNPQQFTAGQVATAKTMTGLSGAPLADAGFSVEDFLSAAADNAQTLVVDPLVKVGQGTGRLLDAAAGAPGAIASGVQGLTFLLPLAIVGVALFLVIAKTRQAAAA